MNNELSSNTTINPVGTAPSSLGEGQKLAGCYILKSRIAASGVSEVWLAQDEVLGKDVTLHFTPDVVMRDPRALAELRSEVKRNRQLIHPSILRVYDFVEDGSYTAISMDKFDGESLGAMLGARGCFDPSDLQPWLKELAETLDDAHRVNLIHRDLSPDNLYSRPSGGILIKGFGVSRAIRDALERAGLAKGEAAHVACMSPQLIDGERPTAADDVYGFGVLVFQLLTGSLPFSGENIVSQIRKAVPPTISSARASAGKSGDIPRSWEEAVAACLAKSPDQRPRNCAEAVKRMFAESGAGLAPAPKDFSQRVQTAALPAVEPSRSADPATDLGRNADVEMHSGVSQTVPMAEQVEVAVTSSTGESEPNLVPPPPPAPGVKRSPVKRSLSANYPDLDRPKSKAPLVLLGLAAVALGFAVVSKLIGNPEEHEDLGVEPIVPALPPSESAPTAAAVTADPSELEPAVPRPDESSPNGENPDSVSPLIGAEGSGSPNVATQPSNGEPSDLPSVDSTAALDGAENGEGKGKIIGATEPETKEPEPKKAAEKPNPSDVPSKDGAPAAPAATINKLPEIPEMPPKLVLDKGASEAEINQLLIERKAIYDKFRAISTAIEFANEENIGIQARKKAELEELGKLLAEKRKKLTPVIQEAATVESERKKLEESKAKAEAAASEAQKAAEAAKKAYADLVASAAEKLAARDAADAELREVDAKIIAAKDMQTQLGDAVAAGTAELQQVKLLLQRADDEQKVLASAYEKARAATVGKMLAANKAKIAEIEEQSKVIEAQRARYSAALPALKELPEMAESVKKMEAKIEEANAQLAAFREEIEQLSGKDIKAPIKGADAPPSVPAGDAKDPKGATAPAPADPTAEKSKSNNSLGMEFVKVGDVMFSRHVTTRAQFESFSKAVGLKPERWRSPGFEQGSDHPVVNVSWREADQFCKWLTAKDRKEGFLDANEAYRLPTDLEWSKAVGLSAESGQTPEDRDMRVENIYPWGTQWPPPVGVGNFAGEETDTELPIRGFNDGFPNTSPVGSFKPNALGLYDMSGNVWQWVSDDWNKGASEKALRGGSWYNGAIPMSLLSSCRIKSSPDTVHDTYGFRIVRAPVQAKK